MLHYMVRGILQMQLRLQTEDQELILNYPGGSHSSCLSKWKRKAEGWERCPEEGGRGESSNRRSEKHETTITSFKDGERSMRLRIRAAPRNWELLPVNQPAREQGPRSDHHMELSSASDLDIPGKGPPERNAAFLPAWFQPHEINVCCFKMLSLWAFLWQ